jgi:glycosyltransferase involved in cell wall biosynthesis
MAQLEETPGQLNHVRVAFVGAFARNELPNGFERVSAEGEADVYHVRHDRLESVRDLKTHHAKAAVVVDLTEISVRDLNRSSLALVRHADVVAVASAGEARALEAHHRLLAGRVLVLPASIDLERFAPDAELAKTRRVMYSRFKRYHRLAPPTVLFAGAYVEDGGLALALDAVYLLREELEDIRFTAIPFGRVDHRYLDQCERRALILGHRGIVEWTPPTDADLAFWFATASVVLVAGEEASRPTVLAAAAARPAVALDAAAAVDVGRAAASDPEALAAAIGALLGPAGTTLGEEKRQELVTRQASPAPELSQLWSSAAFGAGAVSTAALSAVRADAGSAPSSSTVIHPR